MKRSNITFEELSEDYLKFTNKDILRYQRAMFDFVIPSTNDSLLLHLNELNLFLDAIYRLMCGEPTTTTVEPIQPNKTGQKDNEKDLIDEISKLSLQENEDLFAWFNDVDFTTSATGTVESEAEPETEHPFSSGDDGEEEAAVEEHIQNTPISRGVMESIEEVDESQRILARIEFGRISQTLLEWHKDIVSRKEVLTGTYAICYFVSWGAFCRSFHLNICSDETRCKPYVQKTARDFAYCKKVGEYYNVILSSALVCEYKDTVLWNSIRRIFSSLYTFRYSNEMKEYIFALFFRYCDLLSLQQPDAEKVFENPLFVEHRPTPSSSANYTPSHSFTRNSGHIDEEEEEEAEEEAAESDEEEEGLEAMYNAFKSISITVNDNYNINNEFAFEGQPLFCPQLERLFLSAKLYKNKNLITIAYTKSLTRNGFLQGATESWAKMCATVGEDGLLTTVVIAQFRTQIMPMHLYHGEETRFKRESPEASCEARDILTHFRPAEMTHINKIQAMTIRRIVMAYKKDFLLKLKEWVASGSDNEANFELIENELEGVLLTHICTMRWLEMKQVRQVKRLEASFVLEEMTDIEDIHALFYNPEKRKIPVFLKLMRIYYVIDVKKSKLYKTIFFVEAYFLWLALCLRAKLFTFEQLPPELATLLKTMDRLIAFLIE
jgi:hypothetical protein